MRGKRYKKTMRGKKGKSKVWKKVSAEELRLMKMWYKEGGKAPAEIARLLHRDKGTISRRLHNEGPPQTAARRQMYSHTCTSGPPHWKDEGLHQAGDFFLVSCRIS